MKNSSQAHTTVRQTTYPEVDVLGVRVHRITSDQLRSVVRERIRSGEQGIYLYVHLHSLNLAFVDRDLRRIFNASTVTYCDGEGVRLGAGILGSHLPERIPLTRWIYPLLEFCGREGLSVFFLGGEARIVGRAVELLQNRFPVLTIKGYHDGYFHSAKNGSEEVTAEIRRTQPDVLLVGMGSPLQEKWIFDQRQNLSARAIFTVGSCFDYIAGEKPSCPAWMADNGLEWLHRLFHEPRRVWRRYLIGIPVFLYRVLRQRLSQ